jgi:primosomal protein N'
VIVLVAVPVPGLDLLTYAVPDGLKRPPIGARVVVPLGSRIVTGIVVDHAEEGGGVAGLKPIRQVLDAHAFVPPDVVSLARWTAEYYAAGVGDTIPALLPPMARGARADAHKTVRVASITDDDAILQRNDK